MKIEHYIAQLLYRYQCVTVPGFGAFLTEIQPAQLSESSNTFYPPKKVISFNSYLKNNDGLLASHISQSEKTDYETTVENIKKEVNLWRSGLQNNQNIILKNIGTIALNLEGNLVFEPSGHVNYFTDSFGLSSFISPTIKREVLETITETTIEPIAEKEPIVFIPQTSNRNVYLKYAAVFVLGLGTLGAFGFYGNNYYNNKIEAETQLVQTQVQKEVQNKIQEATFFIKSPLPNVTLSVKERKMPYHIVAGAFRNEDNAQKIYERLSSIGFKAKRIEKNKFGLYPVLYGSYATYAEAQAAMIEIHKTQNKEAWLMIKDL